ncbi:MAG: protein-disulfide reductase DsbD domain-containing protein, partial [Bacteroidota bacterium]
MTKKIFVLIATLIFGFNLTAQIEKPITWQFSSSKPNAKAGEKVELIFKAKIQKGWHLFSNNYIIDPGPLMTTVEFKKSPDFELIGTLKAIGDLEKYDDIFEGKVRFFHDNALFKHKVKLLVDNAKIEGVYDGQVCTDIDGRCVPISGPFTFTFDSNAPDSAPKIEEKKSLENNGAVVLPFGNSDSSSSISQIDSAQKTEIGLKSILSEPNIPPSEGGLFAFFIQAFLGGLIALLTPCVYPIIPMTVSFFTKQKKG